MGCAVVPRASELLQQRKNCEEEQQPRKQQEIAAQFATDVHVRGRGIPTFAGFHVITEMGVLDWVPFPVD